MSHSELIDKQVATISSGSVVRGTVRDIVGFGPTAVAILSTGESTPVMSLLILQ